MNLLLTGKAVSNTFDNVMEIDTGGAEKVQPQKHINFNQSISNQALVGAHHIDPLSPFIS